MGAETRTMSVESHHSPDHILALAVDTSVQENGTNKRQRKSGCCYGYECVVCCHLLVVDVDVEAGAVDGVLVVLAPVAGHVPAVIRNINTGHDRLGWSVLYCTVLYR